MQDPFRRCSQRHVVRARPSGNRGDTCNNIDGGDDCNSIDTRDCGSDTNGAAEINDAAIGNTIVTTIYVVITIIRRSCCEKHCIRNGHCRVD